MIDDPQMSAFELQLLNVLIDELSTHDKRKLLETLKANLQPYRLKSLEDQASVVLHIKRGMDERMEEYRNNTWYGDVDRQGGSFTADEIADTGWH